VQYRVNGVGQQPYPAACPLRKTSVDFAITSEVPL
jgi:hypothetical protein